MSGIQLPFVSTTCLPPKGYRETLDTYADAGIERVELGYCPDPTIDLSSVVEAYPFEYTAHNYFLPQTEEFILNLASKNDTIRQRSVKYIRDAVTFCNENGISNYTFHAGFRVDPDMSFQFPTDSVSPYDECFSRFTDSLREILDHSADTAVNLAIENNVVTTENVVNGEPLLMFSKPSEFDRLFNIVDTDELGVLLDTGHLNVSSTTLKYDLETFIDGLTDRVSALHLHWNGGKKDLHRPFSNSTTVSDIIDRLSDAQITIEARYDGVNYLKDDIRWVNTHE